MSRPEFIEVEKYLAGVDYPATKEQLVEHARSHGAPNDVLQALQGMPDGEYDRPTQVSQAVARE